MTSHENKCDTPTTCLPTPASSTTDIRSPIEDVLGYQHTASSRSLVASTSYDTSAAQHTSSHNVQRTAIQVSDEMKGITANVIYIAGENDEEMMPASEVDYWEGMEDVTMDEPYSDSVEILKATPVPSPSTANLPDDLTSSPYYSEIMRQLQTVFGLQTFRHNQLEAITQALSGKDVFVLMPTGGGKSLCYQLPAVCAGGKTKGVTVVVSPLLALMKDQVHALKERNVDVFLWNSEASWEEAMQRMRSGPKPSLMYITPEKLKENNAAQNILGELYNKQQLARFVIDEAHCISTWGQDFREAVRLLS
jgi:superfamily II DNA helicase RecQ